MNWPFVTRSRYDAAMEHRRVAEGQADYWRKRAEQFIDAAAARAGMIHQPTMEHVAPRDRIASAASLLTSALSIKEFDSTEKKDAHVPVQ